MNLGFTLRRAGSDDFINLDRRSPFSYSDTMNKGIEVKAKCNFLLPYHFISSQEWRLSGLINITEWESPPLCILPRERSVGRGDTDSTNLALSDKTTFLLSNADVDKATYVATAANEILADLVDLGERDDGYTVSLTNPPTRIIPLYDASSGKRLEHIARIAQDCGKNFRIGHDGEIIFSDMDAYTDTGIGTDWIYSGADQVDPSKKATTLKIIKTQKVQASFNFKWDSNGDQSETFSAPGLKPNVIVNDLSVTGYVSPVAFFDNANPEMGQLVKLIVLDPEQDESGYPTPTSSGPILSMVALVNEPKSGSVGYIDARLSVEGVPWDGVDGEDLAFETSAELEEAVSWTETPITVSYKATATGPTLETVIKKITMGALDWWYYKGNYYRSWVQFLLSFSYYSIVSAVNGTPVNHTVDEESRVPDGYVDGITFMTQAEADAAKKRMLYNFLADYRGISYTSQQNLITHTPGELIPAWRIFPQSVIKSITVSNSGTSVTAQPKIWW